MTAVGGTGYWEWAASSATYLARVGLNCHSGGKAPMQVLKGSLPLFGKTNFPPTWNVGRLKRRARIWNTNLAALSVTDSKIQNDGPIFI